MLLLVALHPLHLLLTAAANSMYLPVKPVMWCWPLTYMMVINNPVAACGLRRLQSDMNPLNLMLQAPLLFSQNAHMSCLLPGCGPILDLALPDCCLLMLYELPHNHLMCLQSSHQLCVWDQRQRQERSATSNSAGAWRQGFCHQQGQHPEGVHPEGSP